jgi:hypothetical protein
MQVCPQCQRDRLVNHGSAAGTPQKPWQPCGYQLTRTTPRGQPLTTTIHAVWLDWSGISMTHLACLLCVSAQAVLNGSRTCAQKDHETSEPTGRRLILARDESGMTCSRHGRHSGSGRPWIRPRGHGWTGHVGAVTRRPCRSWSIAWRQGTCKGTVRTRGARRRQSSRRVKKLKPVSFLAFLDQPTSAPGLDFLLVLQW